MGSPYRLSRDLYHWFLRAPWSRLLGATAAIYITANALFALLYLAGGDCIHGARPGSFWDVFFFSVQTLGTIGYGVMAPKTIYANTIVAFEAFTGVLGFAVASGLMFAKFSRPNAQVLFSDVAVVMLRNGQRVFSFRMANARHSDIVEASVRVSLLRNEISLEGQRMRRFVDLKLERSHSPLFLLTWQVMHVIDENSPLWGITGEDMSAGNMLVIATVMGIDGTSSQSIHARHVWYPEDIRFSHRFMDVLKIREDGITEVHYQLFHATVVDEALVSGR